VEGWCAAGTLDSLTARYQRGIHTDLWAGGWTYGRALPSGGRVRLGDAFSSSRLQMLPGSDKWKDQNQLSVEYSLPVGLGWTWQTRGGSFVFSDKQTGYMNDIQTYFLGTGAVVQKKSVSVPFWVGLKSDRRYGRTDGGWSYEAALNAPDFQFSGYTNRLDMRVEGDDLRKRKNSGLSLSYLVHKQFFADTRDSLTFNMRRQRRDYYVSEAGDVESWDESVQNAENVLTYGLGRNLRMRFQGGFSSRTLAIRQVSGVEKGLRRERNDFSAAGSLGFVFTASSFISDFSIRFSSEEQNYRFAKSASYSPYSGGAYSILPDNKGNWTTAAFNAKWNWSRADSLTVHSSLQKLQYDTPDPSNVDDRDDVRFWMCVSETHCFSPELTARIGADFYWLHLVYLSGKKSADNNTTRILRLYPSVVFSPSSRVRLVQTAEVLANYVDYDFETLLPGIRSFLYRKFRLDDSLRVGLGQVLAFHLVHRIELDENGKLVWDQWLEEKMLDRDSRTASLEMAVKPFAGVTVAPGYSIYRRVGRRTTEQDASEGERAQEFDSRGPTLRVLCKTDRLLMTCVVSSLNIRTFGGMPAQRTTRVDLDMNWRF
jgi:hypothetical protein